MQDNKWLDNLIEWAKKNKTTIADFDITDDEIIQHIIEINKIYKIHHKCLENNNNNKCGADGFHFFLTKKNDYIYLESHMCNKITSNPYYLLENNYWYSNIDIKSNQQLLVKQDILVEQNQTGKIKLINLLLGIKKNIINVKGIYLFGDHDIGKTFLINAFCNEMALKNRSVIYILLSRFLIDIKKSISNKDNFNDEIIQQMLTVDILVIDEFDIEQQNYFFLSQILYPVLDARNDDNKITIIIANHDLNYMKKQYHYKAQNNIGDKIINRIERLIKTNVFNLNKRKIN